MRNVWRNEKIFLPMCIETLKHYNMNMCLIKGYEHLGKCKIVEEKLDKVKVLLPSGRYDWYERNQIKRIWS